MVKQGFCITLCILPILAWCILTFSNNQVLDGNQWESVVSSKPQIVEAIIVDAFEPWRIRVKLKNEKEAKVVNVPTNLAESLRTKLEHAGGHPRTFSVESGVPMLIVWFVASLFVTIALNRRELFRHLSH